MIDEEIIDKFQGKLKEILDAELKSGNIIIETWRGDWPCAGISVVSLKDPFKTPIQRNLDNIDFRNVNDFYYWKAEYFDQTNKQMLTCRFGDVPDFLDL